MKRIGLILSIMILAGLGCPVMLNSQSTATADDFFAPFFNPAALSFGNASGSGFLIYYDDQGKAEDWYYVSNSDNFSFVYGKVDKKDNYRLSFSNKLFRNNYLGTEINWVNEYIGEAKYGLSYLFRPNNKLSLGVNIPDILNEDRGYHVGFGFKPIMAKTDKLTLTADLLVAKDSEDNYAVTRQQFGLETHLIRGLMLSANYDIKTESAFLNLSLTNKSVRAGSIVELDDNNDIHRSGYYLNFSHKDYPGLAFVPQKKQMYKMSVRQPIVEEKEQMKFGPFVLVKQQRTLTGFIRQINRLKDDDRVSGIVLKNPQFATSFANLEQLRRTFDSFKQSGKTIIVYSDNYGNLGYTFLASIADELYLNPNGGVMLQGISINLPYMNEMLESIGIDVYDLKSHDYKSGLNIFTEKEMTEAERQTYELLLDTLFGEMSEMLSHGRQEKIKKPAADIINEGPYLSAERALEQGLVDKLMYEDEFDSFLEETFGKRQLTSSMPNTKITTEWYEAQEQKIALINAVGNIGTGEGRPGKSIGSKTLSQQIRKARKDKSVKGIILRVDSGGGSAYASDIIAREIKLCKEEHKPVVVSMGGVAASGGYYIAAYADKIVAENTTITGSIGVTGMIPNFHRLFDKIKVNWATVKRGDNADLLSPFKPLQEEHLEMIKQSIAESYEKFTGVVMEARGDKIGDIDSIAQGRIWSGADAKEHGLIDEIGGLDKAIELMKELTGSDSISLEDYSYSYRKISVKYPASGLPGSISIRGLKLHEMYNKYRDYFTSFEEENIQYRMRPFEIEGLE